MKFVMSLFPVLLCLGVAAQDEGSLIYDDPMMEMSEHYVFGDTVFIRASASLKAGVLDTLYAGHDVTVTKKETVSAIVKGFSAPWVKISYRKNSEDRTGYAWAGLLSFTPMRRGLTKFVFGFDRRHLIIKNGDSSFQYTAMLKVVENGVVIDKVAHKLADDESLAFIAGQVFPGRGLSNVKFIVDLDYGGEACGVPSYTYSYAWDGKKLVPMPLLTNIHDSGVFYHNESFILPDEKGGRPNTLIVDVETAESTEETGADGSDRYTVEGETKYYRWDGKTFSLLKTVTKKKKIV